jgi:drug/metabolite transporter (DMT)-like permease
MTKLNRHDQGILFVLCSVALFACYDTGSKLASASVSLVLVLWARYFIQIVWLGLCHRRHIQNRVWQTKRLGLHISRALILLACNALSFLSFKYLPVADVTSIAMLMPLMLTVFAAISLGERVDSLQWGLLALGLLGVFCVVRPGLRPWDVTLLLPIGFLLTYTAFQAVTGMVVKTESTESVFFFTSVIGFLALSALLPVAWTGMPDPSRCGLVFLIASCSALGHQWLVVAYSKTEASSLTPFLYFQLVFAALGGWLVFEEIPDTPALMGGLLIVASGIWSALRKRAQSTGRMRFEARGLPPRRA